MQSMRRCAGLVDLRLRRRIVLAGVFGDVTLSVFHPHPGNHLPLFVGGKVGDLVGDVHVPVNAFARLAQRRIAAASLDQQTNDARRVLLIDCRNG